MRLSRRDLLAALVFAAVACAPALVTPVVQATGAQATSTLEVAPTDESVAPSATTGRLSGSTRYGTAASISRWQFADPVDAPTVYLARGDILADALAAGVLTDGPVLLVRPGCSAPPGVTTTEIDRLDPERVIALGGTGAVCEDTLQAAADGRPTGRLAGTDRAGTAAAIAQHEFSGGAAIVYLARGEGSPDAVAGGSLTDGPILLVSGSGTQVPDITGGMISALDPDRVLALGGPSAVSDAALAQAADGRPTGRVFGMDRWVTSVAIAEQAFPSGSDVVFLARGDQGQFADATVSGVLTDGPVLLVDGPCDRIATAVTNYLGEVQPQRVIALGGTAAVCDGLLQQAAQAATPPPPPPDCSSVPCVALTFDDGPSAYTSQLVNTLDDLGVPATFFVVGQAAAARPATVKRTFDHGYQVQNHSWDHPQLQLLPRSQQLWQYTATRDHLSGLGITPTDMLRPPYGSWNAATRTLGVPLILWSIDTRDWENRDTATIRAHVRNTIHPGAIVLQHDTIPESVAAVPGIVADLRARGYHFVTVEDLVPWAGPGDLVYSRGQVVPAGSDGAPTLVDGAPFPTLEVSEHQPAE